MDVEKFDSYGLVNGESFQEPNYDDEEDLSFKKRGKN